MPFPSFYSIIAQVNETLQQLPETNGTESEKPKSTPEGMLTAYVSLVIMALIPIVVGSFKSVDHHISQKKKSRVSKASLITWRVSMKILAGHRRDSGNDDVERCYDVPTHCLLCSLWSLRSFSGQLFTCLFEPSIMTCHFIWKQIFSKEYINLLMTGYFVVLGAMAMSHILTPIFRSLKPDRLVFAPYHVSLTREAVEGVSTESSLLDFRIDAVDLTSFGISSLLAVWYLLKKHWIANNLFGVAFAVNGVELLHLNSVGTGCILLSGLFLYDIFWVFGTDVMVTVAKSFEAPIKLVFPQDFLERGVFGTNFAMLGLGDIVIPGIFIALLLRFDKSLCRSSNTYFNASFIAYIIGLVATIVVMSVFKHAQPALLYLVPACISFPVLLSLVKGDFKAMFAYEDHPQQPEQKSD